MINNWFIINIDYFWFMAFELWILLRASAPRQSSSSRTLASWRSMSRSIEVLKSRGCSLFKHSKLGDLWHSPAYFGPWKCGDIGGRTQFGDLPRWSQLFVKVSSTQLQFVLWILELECFWPQVVHIWTQHWLNTSLHNLAAPQGPRRSASFRPACCSSRAAMQRQLHCSVRHGRSWFALWDPDIQTHWQWRVLWSRLWNSVLAGMNHDKYWEFCRFAFGTC